MRRFLSLVLQCCLVAWCVCSVHAGTVQLPQSGQTKCYDTAGTEIGCAGTGQDGEIQAGVAWPEPRFTVSGDCVTDNLTGLMWVKSPDSIKRMWDDALSYANGLYLCGYDDWRLPNINELRSLVHSGYNEESCEGVPCVSLSDWLNSKGFSNSNVQGFYSSSTSFAYYFLTAMWDVNMWGKVAYFYKTYNSETNDYVWPVRGGQNDFPDSIYPANIWKTGQTASAFRTGDDGDLERGVAWPNPRFSDQGDGTIRDNLTGLIWLKEADCFGTMPWDMALSFANGLATGQCGLSDGSHAGDWRLPNREELESLIDFSRSDPALPTGHPFANVRSYGYWSSTTSAVPSTNCAWFVTMWIGYLTYADKANSDYYVWPVRGDIVLENDSTGPSLSITSHSNGQHVTTSSITLAGTASDSGLGDNGIQQVTVNGNRADNDTASGGGTANWSKALTLNPGANIIAVIAYDNSTNHNGTSKTITINYDQLVVPVIDKILGVKEPGLIVRIIGTNFGDTQGDSVVYIGPKTFDSSSRRIKLWSDTKIRIRLPKYQCGWFNGQDYRYGRVWVTVDGVDSNKKRIKVIKPDICP
jgi:hypothetical protein